jgi:hypothetical protein
MKNRVLTALLIAVLALPAFAQTNSARPKAKPRPQAQPANRPLSPLRLTALPESRYNRPLGKASGDI